MKKVLVAFLFFTSIICQAKSIRILEIDTGVDLSHEQIKKHVNPGNWFKDDYFDSNGHGTHVAGLILKDTCKEVELVSCNYFQIGKNKDRMQNTNTCLRRALHEHFDFINYSSSGSSDQTEYEIIEQLVGKTILIVSVGNDHRDISKPGKESFPACYPLTNIVAVGNLDEDHYHRHYSSNYGLFGMKWRMGTRVLSTTPYGEFKEMTGSSQATAIYTNELLKKKCKGLK